MKRLSIILIVGICTLSSALCRAESVPIPHVFEDMKGTTLTWGSPPNYTIGTTPLVTYTCTNGATFSTYGDKAYICIYVPNGGIIQTSPAVEDLTLVTITHTKGSAPSGFKAYISTDNSSWTEITSSIVYRSTTMEVPMPAKGNYYLRIENNSGAAINFPSFIYTYDACHCLRVVSE